MEILAYSCKMQQIKSSVVNSMILRQNHFCCLCFKTVADCAVHIEDKVIVKIHENTFHEIYMTDILTTILGPKISDQLSIFNAVCNECSSGAINSYKFYAKCKDNLQKIGHIIDGLKNGAEILCQTNSKSVKAGFVYINTENFEYRGYNSSSTASTGLLAYRKFQNLQCKYEYEFINKPAMKVPRSNYRANEKIKILRLRLVQLNPKVLKKHSRVFVCPKCDQFFVRKYSMHLHYRKTHFSDGDFPFIGSNVVKTNECDNLTNLEPNRLCSEPIIKTNESHSVISQVKVKIEPQENGFVAALEPYKLCSEPIIKPNERHLVISQVKVKIEPEENGSVAAFRTYLDENKK